MKDLEDQLDERERELILSLPVPPLDKPRVVALVDRAMAILVAKDYPWDKPGLRLKLEQVVRVGLRALARMEFSTPPDVFPSWDHFLQSSQTLEVVREYHTEQFEFERRVAANNVGRFAAINYTLGD